MAAKTAKVNVRIEPKLKKEADRILDALGLSTADAIRVFLKQIVYRRKIPFDVSIPNRATQKAMAQARKSKHLKTYPSPEDHFKSHKI